MYVLMYVNVIYLNVGVNFSDYVFFFPLHFQKPNLDNKVSDHSAMKRPFPITLQN